MKKYLVDLSPLKTNPAFARLFFGLLISSIGTAMTLVAVGLQIYAITKDTFAVGLVGGISLVPMVIAAMWGGMIVDAFDRKKVALISGAVGWLAVLGIAILSFSHQAMLANGEHPQVWLYYVFATLNSISGTIAMTARRAIIPMILPAEMISRAAALNGIAFGIMMAVGPSLAGLFAGTIGLPVTFVVDLVLSLSLFFGLVSLPKLERQEGTKPPGLGSLLDSVRFLRGAHNLRTSFLLDIIAMMFGRVNVLLPAACMLVVGGGEIVVGLLTSAMALGTMLASLFSGYVKNVHMHGIAIRNAVIAYGGFVAGLGVVLATMMLTGNTGDPEHIQWVGFVFAALMFVGMGLSDETSAIFRMGLSQVATPDHMQGRMQGILVMVVTGGPRIGDMFAGFLASAIALWSPALFGGIAIVVLAIALARPGSKFAKYDFNNPEP